MRPANRVLAALVTAAALTACSRTSGQPQPQSAATAPSPSPAATTAAPTPSSTRIAPATEPPAASRSASPAPAHSLRAPSASAYAFPVLPLAHATFAHVHHDYPATDILATCGDQYRATTTGVIIGTTPVDVWNSRVNDGATRGGLSVTLLGSDGVRYYGSHLQRIALGVTSGLHVTVGQELGRVGNTGDARGLHCHVHYGISPPCSVRGDWWNRRGVLYPWPYLESWRAGGQRSPAPAIDALPLAVGCPPHPKPGT